MHSLYSSQYAPKADILVIESPASTSTLGGGLNPLSHLSDSGSVNQPPSIEPDPKGAKVHLLGKLTVEMLNVLGVCEDTICGRGSLIVPFHILAANTLSFFLKGELRHTGMTSHKGDLISQCLLVKW